MISFLAQKDADVFTENSYDKKHWDKQDMIWRLKFSWSKNSNIWKQMVKLNG
jgi:hypothetical protein